MKRIKIIEGSAQEIEDFANSEELKEYEFDSIQYTYTGYAYISTTEVSDTTTLYYVAVFKPRNEGSKE